MKLSRFQLAVTVLILVSFAVSLITYDVMPDKMAIHWNMAGEANGFGPKALGLFLSPVMSVGIVFLLINIVKLDPLKKNIDKFRNHFENFIIMIVAFLTYVHVLTIGANLFIPFNMTFAIIPALSALFWFVGIMMEHTKRNWFIGFKTPWTLSSDKVWDATHKKAGKLFKAVGAITLIGLVFPNYLLWILFVPLMLTIAYLAWFSYAEYKKL